MINKKIIIKYSKVIENLPNLTTLTFWATNPSNKLSAAILECAQANIFCNFNPLDCSSPILNLWFFNATLTATMEHAVRVLPVPGGPWIKVIVWLIAFFNDDNWDSFIGDCFAIDSIAVFISSVSYGLIFKFPENVSAIHLSLLFDMKTAELILFSVFVIFSLSSNFFFPAEFFNGFSVSLLLLPILSLM